MKVAKVEYTVQPGFVEQNKANIQSVMEALRANPIQGIRYFSSLKEDGQTFVHINIMANDEVASQFGDMAEFKAFRMALKASEPINSPQLEHMTLVDAGFDLS